MGAARVAGALRDEAPAPVTRASAVAEAAQFVLVLRPGGTSWQVQEVERITFNGKDKLRTASSKKLELRGDEYKKLTAQAILGAGIIRRHAGGYLVVKNGALTEQFAIYDASETRKRLLEELAAKEMTMPKLHDWLVALLHEVNLPVGSAIQHEKFSLMDRQRLKNWQRQFHEQINSIREIILPGEP